MAEHFKYQEGKRIGAYDSGCDGIRFLIEVDEEAFTEEQVNALANWITKAIFAKKGHDKFINEISRLRDEIQFRVLKGGRPSLLSLKAQRILLEGIHWGIAYHIGFQKSAQELGLEPDFEADEYDFISPQGFKPVRFH